MIARGCPSSAVEHRVRSIYDHLIRRWTCMLVGGKVDDAAPADHPPSGEARALQVRLLHVVVRRGAVLRRRSTPIAGSAATMRSAPAFAATCRRSAIAWCRTRTRCCPSRMTHRGSASTRFRPAARLGRVPESVQRILERPQRPPAIQSNQASDAGAGRQGVRQALGRVRAGAPCARSRQSPAVELLRDAADQRRHTA